MKKIDYLAAQLELPFYPDLGEVCVANAAHIDAFKEAYWAHTDTNIEIRDNMSEEFIRNVAADCTLAKKDLRRMMRRSKYWREDLQAWAIPMFHKQTPNQDNLAKIIDDAMKAGDAYARLHYCDLRSTIGFFATPDNVPASDEEKAIFERLARGAYREGQNKRKTFMKICKRLNLWNDSPSSFQYYLRKYDDERGIRDLHYTLYVSINPAHFLSMSNPKGDNRGEALTSCHSFNSYYEYSSGCVGYARDSVSLIAFTAANDGEALLNRKTSRQIFMYHKGALIQSRLYTSRNGDSYGGVETRKIKEYWEYKEYRMAIQDLIAACEGSASKWQTADYRNGYGALNKFGVCVNSHEDFGGYVDWEKFSTYKGMAKVSVRNDMKKQVEEFTAGATGLHIVTGEMVERGYSIAG